MLPGLSPVIPGTPLVVTRFPICSQSCHQCSKIYLKANAFVQSTLGFNHPGILIWHLPNTPRESWWQKYIWLISDLDPDLLRLMPRPLPSALHRPLFMLIYVFGISNHTCSRILPMHMCRLTGLEWGYLWERTFKVIGTQMYTSQA